MHGLVSLLPSPFYEQVENLWAELKEGHDIDGIRVTPYPHFSWQIAREYDFAALEEIVLKHTGETEPFIVRTGGLGVFSGPQPVIYISVVKDANLMEFHARLWYAAQDASTGISPYYNPSNWMPHISLAYQDVSRGNIGALMERLSFRSFNWEMTIDNIALIYEPDGEIGVLKFKHNFSEVPGG